jgi:multidrug transporter EmrE-like cation transporter
MNKLLATPILFAVYTVFSVSGMVLVKYAAPLLKAAMVSGSTLVLPGLMVCAGAGMYVLGFLVWMLILAREPLTVAYPIAVGLTMLFSTILGTLLLRENLTWPSFLGTLLVLVGVTLLARA